MRREDYYSVGKNLTAGVENTVFTVPDGYEARVTMVFITNNSGNSKSFSAAWNDDGTDITFASSKSLNSKEFIQYGGEFGDFLILDEGDYMTITPEAGSDYTVITSFMLFKHDAVKFDLS